MKILWLVLSLVLPLPLLAAEPYARATLDEPRSIVSGQQVYVTVDVFAPNFFTSPPQFPLFELPGALVTLPQERSMNLNETKDDVQYSGIRRRYAVVPQIPGNYQIPVIEIELGYSVDGATVRGTARTAPVSFSVGGDATAPAAFAARNVSIGQSFDRPVNALKVGDSVVRTITIAAEETQAIIIPPISPGDAEGLAQYEKSPTIEDGVLIEQRSVSRRTETLIYTATTEGSFTIPVIEYPWFDLDSHTMAVARLAATDVTVAAATASIGIAPDAEIERAGTPFEQRRQLMFRVILSLGAIACSYFFLRIVIIAVRWFKIWRQRLSSSRRNRLRKLQKSILQEEPRTVYASLQAWSQAEGFRTLHSWAGKNDPLLASVRQLEEALYSGRKGSFDRKQLAMLVGGSFREGARVSSPPALPPLNPVSATGSE